MDTSNTFIGNNGFLCNTNSKKRLHPKCVKLNNAEKKNIEIKKREQKILQILTNLNTRVGPLPEKHRNEYIRFVQNMKRNPNDNWIFQSYTYQKDPQTSILYPQYINDPKKIPKTRRQQIYAEAIHFHEIQDLKNIYFRIHLSNSIEPSDREAFQYLQKCRNLIQQSQILSKIRFHFDFSQFQQKLLQMKNEISIYQIQKEDFFQQNILEQFLLGQNDLSDIFPPQLYSFLIKYQIISQEFIDSYYSRYTNRNRNVANYRLRELFQIFTLWIDFIFNLLQDSNFSFLNSNKFTANELNILFVDKFLTSSIEKYLFFINYGMHKYYNIRSKIFDICFTDFYYVQLKINLHLLKSFFPCQNLDIQSTPTETGGFGEIYNISNQIIKKTKKPIYERAFFEFFKHSCVYHIFNSHDGLRNTVPNVFELVFGENEIYLFMEKIEGTHLLSYYSNIVQSNHLSLEQRDAFAKDLLLNVASFVEKFQQIRFLHFDLNPRNILIVQNTPSTIEFKFIDFDFSVIQFEGIYLFNLSAYFDPYHIFMKNRYQQIQLSPFAKSIDLFRFTLTFFILPSYLKSYLLKNQNIETIYDIYHLSTPFLQKLRLRLYGTDKIIPDQIDTFFSKENSPIRHFQNQRGSFCNILIVRKYIFLEFAKNNYSREWIRNKWIEKNWCWVESFLPYHFIQSVLSIS